MSATTEQRALLGAKLIQSVKLAQTILLNVMRIIIGYNVHQGLRRILALHAEQIHLLFYAHGANGSKHAIKQTIQTLADVRAVMT